MEKEKKPILWFTSSAQVWALPYAREYSQITACPPFSLLYSAGTEHPLFDSSFSFYSLYFQLLTQIYVRNYQSHFLLGARPSARVSHHYKPLSSSYLPSYFPWKYVSHLAVENLENFIKNKKNRYP